MKDSQYEILGIALGLTGLFMVGAPALILYFYGIIVSPLVALPAIGGSLLMMTGGSSYGYGYRGRREAKKPAS